MILIAMVLQAAAPAPAPSAEAIALARQVADSAALVRLIPTIASKEAQDLIGDHPEWTAADQTELRSVAQSVAATGRDRLVVAMAPIYAARLSVADMRAIVTFESSPAAQARRTADLPAVMAATSVLNGYDFKAEVLKAFCAKTGKGCAKGKRRRGGRVLFSGRSPRKDGSREARQEPPSRQPPAVSLHPTAVIPAKAGINNR